MKTFFCLILMIVILLPRPATANEDAEHFFQHFIALAENFDPAIVDLYSENARIHSARTQGHGQEEIMELNGIEWKALVPQVMPLAKAQNDRSTFSNVKISKQGKGFKIKAERYSERKCYTDHGYYLLIEPSASGALQIIEEYLETQSQLDCK